MQYMGINRRVLGLPLHAMCGLYPETPMWFDAPWEQIAVFLSHILVKSMPDKCVKNFLNPKPYVWVVRSHVFMNSKVGSCILPAFFSLLFLRGGGVVAVEIRRLPGSSRVA